MTKEDAEKQIALISEEVRKIEKAYNDALDAANANKEKLVKELKAQVEAKGYACPSTSQIVPVILGESEKAVQKAQQLQQAGFYIMPVRPPTVPQNSSRLRICLTAQIQSSELAQCVALL